MSHLEYAIQSWTQKYIKEQNLLERVQRRATKLIPTLRNVSCEEQLKQLNMVTLHKQRIRGDMIEVFDIQNNFDKVNPEVLFVINNESVTRGNGTKVKVQRYNTIDRKSCCNVRAVDHWNRLPASVVSSKIIDILKSRLDKYFLETGLLSKS